MNKLCLANLRTEFSTILRTEHSESVQKKTICSYSSPLILTLVLALIFFLALDPYLAHEYEKKIEMREKWRQRDRFRKRKSQRESERDRDRELFKSTSKLDPEYFI